MASPESAELSAAAMTGNGAAMKAHDTRIKVANIRILSAVEILFIAIGGCYMCLGTMTLMQQKPVVLTDIVCL